MAPSAAEATLAAARIRFPNRRIVAVFQPHLFSRTRDFASELGRALAEADEIWVSDVYPAREQPIPGITGALVAEAAREAGAAAVSFLPELSEVAAQILGRLYPGDICLTMGAGSIEFLGEEILTGLRRDRSQGETGLGREEAK